MWGLAQKDGSKMGEFWEKDGRKMCKEIIKLIKMKLLALLAHVPSWTQPLAGSICHIAP